MEQVFDTQTIQLLDKKLDSRLVSERVGGGNTKLKYIEGHDAIDQANRLFGYGNWTYRPISCEQTVLLDPMTGEAVGVSYKAQVELVVRGCVAPLVEVGSQPVAAWNVNDAVMSRRKRGDNKPVEEWERVSARRTIVESHEMAEKGAVTDALKRALRTFGDQFGNGLYGDGRVELPDASETRPQAQREPVSIEAGKSTTAQDGSVKTRLNALYDRAIALGKFSKGATTEESGKAFLVWVGEIVGANIANAQQITVSRLEAVEKYLDSAEAA